MSKFQSAIPRNSPMAEAMARKFPLQEGGRIPSRLLASLAPRQTPFTRAGGLPAVSRPAFGNGAPQPLTGNNLNMPVNPVFNRPPGLPFSGRVPGLPFSGRVPGNSFNGGWGGGDLGVSPGVNVNPSFAPDVATMNGSIPGNTSMGALGRALLGMGVSSVGRVLGLGIGGPALGAIANHGFGGGFGDGGGGFGGSGGGSFGGF